ncbi:hypothetical protein OAO18_05420 [Francisellaceae bacterium]|nr:hypothetical protein [Francisellaceae bacterium]
MPEHIASDEKHGKIKGQKVYVTTTVANGCILGSEVSPEANEIELTRGYKIFADESKNIDSEYQPKTVNIDGWEATQLAFAGLFFGITIIRCFLHAFIKIRDCCKKNSLFEVICGKTWRVYQSKDKKTFSQRLRRFKDWAADHLTGTTVLEKITKTYERSQEYQLAYDHPDCYRTSNMCDRLMRFLDKALFNRQNFHGTIESATEMMHSWAILQNYYPHNIRATVNKGLEYTCPASELNGLKYSNNWLDNLVTASSMNGYCR